MKNLFPLSALALALPALAQEAPPLQKVVITGSHIQRSDTETTSPVQVITREEIAQMGASTIKDVLDTITSNTGALSDLSGNNSFAAGASGLSLRNLGKSSTLILLNGRRIANYGLADGGREVFVNIDAIPAEIIERVEILLDGASAVYGSDAVAGVVNLITVKAYRGTALKASARNSLLNGSIDRDRTASLTVGRGDLAADGYNAFAHLELYHRLPYSDREIEPAVAQWYKDYVNPSFGVKSTYANPGNYIVRNANGTTTAVPAPNCSSIEGGLCRFDQYDRLGIHAEAQRVQLHSGARMNWSRTTQLFGEFSYSDLRTTYYNPPPIMQYTGSPQTWYGAKEGVLKSFTEPLLPVGHYYNPYPVATELRYRFSDDPAIYKNATHARQYRLLAGAEGTDYGWDWSSAVGVMGTKAGFISRGAKNAEEYTKAVLNGEYRFGVRNDDALLLRMFPKIEFTGESRQAFIEARASRELMALPGGAMSLAVGADYRTDSFLSGVSDNVANAQIVGYGSISVDGARHISALYAELEAPVHQRFLINVAMRTDKVGEAERSFTPKLAAKFKLTKQIMLRATLASGFRAPNVAETGKVSLSAFNNGVVDPKRCVVANAMYQVLRTGNDLDKADATRVRDSLGCSVSFAAAVKGNPGLAPERSKSLNYGIVLDPFKDLSMSIDYYRIERHDEIGTQSVDQILAQEDGLIGRVNRNPISADDQRVAARVKALSGVDLQFPVGAITSLFQSYENLSKTRVSGIDVDLSYKWNLGSNGRISTALKANYQLGFQRANSAAGVYDENLVSTYGNYRYVLRETTNWSYGPWVIGGVLNYWPSTPLYTDKYDGTYHAAGCAARGIPADYCKIERDFTLDAHWVYKGWKNGVLIVNLDNVLNRAPVVDVRSVNPPLRGRSLRAAYDYKF